jgi:hypothetical protein
MATTLQMVFQNQIGKNVSISVPEVKEDITDNEIKALMQLILSKNVFETTGGDLVALMSANLITREVEEIEVR